MSPRSTPGSSPLQQAGRGSWRTRNVGAVVRTLPECQCPSSTSPPSSMSWRMGSNRSLIELDVGDRVNRSLIRGGRNWRKKWGGSGAWEGGCDSPAWPPRQNLGQGEVEDGIDRKLKHGIDLAPRSSQLVAPRVPEQHFREVEPSWRLCWAYVGYLGPILKRMLGIFCAQQPRNVD